MTVIYVKTALIAAMAATLLSFGVSSPGIAEVSTKAIPAQCLSMDVSPYSPPELLSIRHGKAETRFQVEIANTDETREQGLMCRPELAVDRGMLFEFKDMRERNFWMQNTIVGLDIVYIAQNGSIVSIQKNAKPFDRTPLPSHGAASGVLEIQAGLSDKLGLKPGDKVIHPFFHKP
ncbi:hypothetical protein AEAC466_07990 [Asticcacaulis sp. AC466]|uniref:DUF192 domain-containing protein n=1 Tax=Asticcacaulis sp. AC466 TaxID=1282362 RepID=UPI0003C3BF38|nr:DUF192 domain-containing protein [Asticcacaulis sp. AC466]ESQ84289.1 hypothetical protein AEAC466_07990 [Asticcacaulis sp. AC466]